MKKSRLLVSLTLFGILLGSAPANLYAAPSDEDAEGVSATLLCGGAHGGTIMRSSSWSFRNFNESGSIQIDHITIYDRYGAILYEAMPPTQSSNGVPPSDVGPHSSITFGSNLLLGDTNPKRPLQFILDWSSVSGKKVLTLDGYVVRANNPADGPGGYFTFDCRTINVK